MDPLKKLVADRLRMRAAGPHPDAEALSAFAENALAPSERQTVIAHLASCSDCREVLFLSASQAAEVQQVVSVPRPRFRLALRWGTLAACVVIGAVVLITRHEPTRTAQVAKNSPPAGYVTPAAPAAEQSTIAAEKPPAELNAMRDRRAVAKVAAPATATSGHAEPKDITAKPTAAFEFSKSGQVSLDEPTANAKLESRTVAGLSVNGRNAAELERSAPAPPPPVPAVTADRRAGIGGAVGENANSYGYISSNAPAQAGKETAFHGYAEGTVLDASGAVIPNAKITAVGPLGEKTAVSDSSGKFFFDQLAPGTYSFRADVPGFGEAQVQQVAVLADKPATMDFKLQPGMAAEVVSVETAAPAVAASAQMNRIVVRGNESSDALQAAQARMQSTTETADLKKQKAANLRKASRADSAVLAFPVWQWSLTPQGAVQRSNDSGKSWQPVSVAEGITFRAIFSVATHVWVGGDAGVLYHSADSGQHWTHVVPAVSGDKLQADVTQIQFSDSQHGSITASDGQVWTTADGGQTWTRK
jgi:anti-sigma factor ChrR (cupin superfamily)